MADARTYQSCVLDACALISFVKGETIDGVNRADVVDQILRDAQAQRINVYLPTIARLEVLQLGPNADSEEKLAAWLDSPYFQYVELDAYLADRAREIAQATEVRTGVDAAYIATAQLVQAPLMLTWDDKIPSGTYGSVEVCRPYANPGTMRMGD